MNLKLRQCLRGTACALAFSLLPMGLGPARATFDCAADAMIVFDGSSSMEEVEFDVTEPPRIEGARLAMHLAIPEIAETRRLGLLIYGPGAGDSCKSIDLRFGPRKNAADAITGAIDALKPAGLTPLAASVLRAAEALDYRSEPGVVVLVTDGNETCGGAPCALGEALNANGHDLTVHVIGFRVRVDFFTWDNPEQKPFEGGDTVARCLADRTGGQFVTTETVEELVAAMQATLGCPIIGWREAETQNAPA